MKDFIAVLSPSEFLDRNGGSREVSDVSIPVRKIIAEVRKGGDRALLKLTQKFDGVSIRSVRLSKSSRQCAGPLLTASSKRRIVSAKSNSRVPAQLIKDMKLAYGRILRYHTKTADYSMFWRESSGAALGRIVQPIRRVGIYVPGGSAPLFSSLLMAGAAARAASVKNIAVATPPPVSDTIIAAARICGIDEIYQIGGAQAIAALAYGTESIEAVDKIVGPGNRYVAEAKRQVFGHVGIDSIAGPSEILILADHTSQPRLVAADLLAQAEHDADARAMLLTTFRDAIPDIARELRAQLARLPRRKIAQTSLERSGCIVLCENRNQMIGLANQCAPEHLAIMTAEPWEIAEQITAAGAIFVGADACEVLGDYIAGPNHILPTSRTARFSAPLSARDFVSVSSLQWFAYSGSRPLIAPAARLARAEGLEAHARAAESRIAGGARSSSSSSSSSSSAARSSARSSANRRSSTPRRRKR